MITVAGQMFIEYEKVLDNSNQMIKRYEEYIGDYKIKKDIVDKICGDNVKDICYEKKVICKKESIKRFNRFFNSNKR